MKAQIKQAFTEVSKGFMRDLKSIKPRNVIWNLLMIVFVPLVYHYLFGIDTLIDFINNPKHDGAVMLKVVVKSITSICMASIVVDTLIAVFSLLALIGIFVFKACKYMLRRK